MSQANSAVTAKQSELASLQGQLPAASAGCYGPSKRSHRPGKDGGGPRAKLPGLTEGAAAAEQAIADQKAVLETEKPALVQAGDTLAASTASVDAKKSELTALQGQLSDHQAAVAAANSAVADARAAIATLNRSADDLLAQITDSMPGLL